MAERGKLRAIGASGIPGRWRPGRGRRTGRRTFESRKVGLHVVGGRVSDGKLRFRIGWPAFPLGDGFQGDSGVRISHTLVT
jgi:hypothetical protein